MTVFAVRAIWIAAQVLVLLEIDCAKWRGYRWWAAYVLVSAMLSVGYWPEFIPGWAQAFASWLVAVLLLRTCACLEALHWQTADFPWWSRLMAGAYLFAGFVVACLALVRDGRWAGLLVEYRRYLQIWTFLVLAIVEMLIISVGWWRDRRQDWHVAALLALSANHARVSIMAMTVHPEGHAWHEANWIATAADSAVLLAWVFAHRTEQSGPKPARAGGVAGSPRPAIP